MQHLMEFDELAHCYREHGFSLYLVGGSVRDWLLKRPFSDLDFVTDALPEDMLPYLSEVKDTFRRYGSLQVKVHGHWVDVTTLREEGEYRDHRHPSFLRFVKDPKLDYPRRDFTINALYLDEHYHLLDYCHGEDDLKQRLIRFLGDPTKRIQEDPLRICRAERFAKLLSFRLEEKTKEAIQKNYDLLQTINSAKLEEEKKKGWTPLWYETQC